MHDRAESPTMERVLTLVATVAGHHGLQTEIKANDHLVDRGMTSMAMVDLMLALEAHFDLIIPNAHLTADNFATVVKLTRMLDDLLLSDCKQY